MELLKKKAILGFAAGFDFGGPWFQYPEFTKHPGSACRVNV
jgi:hypothetical protein